MCKYLASASILILTAFIVVDSFKPDSTAIVQLMALSSELALGMEKKEFITLFNEMEFTDLELNIQNTHVAVLTPSYFGTLNWIGIASFENEKLIAFYCINEEGFYPKESTPLWKGDIGKLPPLEKIFTYNRF